MYEQKFLSKNKPHDKRKHKQKIAVVLHVNKSHFVLQKHFIIMEHDWWHYGTKSYVD